ncbi:MAG TPA: hypothetical protein VKT53_01070 [Candidatus Acidoferrum sp.]|nr:hypothetical protein [Candidatus Acidoferrum sp.]
MTKDSTPWYLRQVARKAFSFAAIATVVVLASIYSLGAFIAFANQRSITAFEDNPWAKLLAFIIGVIGVPFVLLLWYGMISHAWATIQGARKRLFWLTFLIVANWMIAAFYYYFIYRKQFATKD